MTSVQADVTERLSVSFTPGILDRWDGKGRLGRKMMSVDESSLHGWLKFKGYIYIYMYIHTAPDILTAARLWNMD